MISVIVPTYNRPHLIRRSLDSIRAQTVQGIEIVVIDGSNSDATKRLVKGINDSKVKYSKIANRSAANSRNIGLRMAKGEFIAFNDDDDIWIPEKLERQMEFLQKQNRCSICFTAFRKRKRGLDKIIPSNIESTCSSFYQQLLFRNLIGLQTLLLKREALDDTSFDEKLNCLEDWDFVLSLSRKYRFGYLDEISVIFGDTPGSVNKSAYYIKAASYKRIYSKYISDIRKDVRTEVKHLLSIASNLYLAGNLQEGRKYFAKAIEMKPTSLLPWLTLLCTYSGEVGYKYIFKIFEKITGREP